MSWKFKKKKKICLVPAQAAVLWAPWLGFFALQPQGEGILWTGLFWRQVRKFFCLRGLNIYRRLAVKTWLFNTVDLCLQWSVQVAADGPKSSGTWLFKEVRAHRPQLPGQVIIRFPILFYLGRRWWRDHLHWGSSCFSSAIFSIGIIFAAFSSFHFLKTTSPYVFQQGYTLPPRG